MIEIRQLSKTFGAGENQVAALQNVNLSIQEGEIFGIIGLSGAGKSTLVRCINLLERPDEGAVLFHGEDLMKLPAKELRKRRRIISMIFQSFNLLDQRTALDNICFPMELAGIPRKEAKQRALTLLETVGLPDKAGAYPVQLSGGQEQRIAIA
ncbi:MAG: ATP-binding cassette domain-containing protein, partial [Oscillospiraceae bacterium]|nr:ATP-binding cassette domain-containing protein [Oscillospiraceae bacterium]